MNVSKAPSCVSPILCSILIYLAELLHTLIYFKRKKYSKNLIVDGFGFVIVNVNKWDVKFKGPASDKHQGIYYQTKDSELKMLKILDRGSTGL